MEPSVLTEALSDTSSTGSCGVLHGTTEPCTFLSRTSSRGSQAHGVAVLRWLHNCSRTPCSSVSVACARDGALQVKEAKQWILHAAMLSRNLTIQMCSFKYDHQLKAVSRSLEFSGAESCSLLNEVSTMHYFWCQDCAGNSIWLQVQSLLPSLLGTTSSIPTETELIERYRPWLIC